MHSQRFTALRRRATPALKSAGKFIIINAVTYAPGGLAGWAVKSVARRPLRLLLAAALEPVLSKTLKRLAARFIRDNDEKTAK
ncbi:phage shock protein PspD [Pantoea sp. Mb-10]|uniref:phage shock protein PspD n=1 Tax=unclassified Pantoea TaxID=2630326 RepID=UPI001E5257E1|nr:MULTISPECIES: phage shock protein PspD [unclassified Pantoea]MCE0491557.1 phage shock protein PspD [Pantoea sp. Mb-10]MCE0502371.1 phage shock protein PspD [Pantoea sp. Pb-8]